MERADIQEVPVGGEAGVDVGDAELFDGSSVGPQFPLQEALQRLTPKVRSRRRTDGAHCTARRNSHACSSRNGEACARWAATRLHCCLALPQRLGILLGPLVRRRLLVLEVRMQPELPEAKLQSALHNVVIDHSHEVLRQDQVKGLLAATVEPEDRAKVLLGVPEGDHRPRVQGREDEVVQGLNRDPGHACNIDLHQGIVSAEMRSLPACQRPDVERARGRPHPGDDQVTHPLDFERSGLIGRIVATCVPAIGGEAGQRRDTSHGANSDDRAATGAVIEGTGTSASRRGCTAARAAEGSGVSRFSGLRLCTAVHSRISGFRPSCAGCRPRRLHRGRTRAAWPLHSTIIMLNAADKLECVCVPQEAAVALQQDQTSPVHEELQGPADLQRSRTLGRGKRDGRCVFSSDSILPHLDAVIEAHKQSICDVRQAVEVTAESLAGVNLPQHLPVSRSHHLHRAAILPEEDVTVVRQLQAAAVAASPLARRRPLASACSVGLVLEARGAVSKPRAQPQELRQRLLDPALAVHITMDLPDIDEEPAPAEVV
mmetsp:Transcript_28776/g.72863  ORF Transcript_28776/g.72863 Transcript_28776/m.72863 type:complete len:544 (-) Transcript_28776:266-1897(-)